MNSLLHGVILGFVQGLTEFLPVSSSGHLTLLEYMGIGERSLMLNLALHIATLLAVVIVLRKDILRVVKNPFGEEMRFLLLSAVPTGIIALVVRLYLPDTTFFLPFFFILTSFVLVLPKIIQPKERALVGRNCIKTAIVAGVCQGVACFSGLSRSGTTVTAMRLCGVEEESSARLSFLMSIPVIVASTVAEMVAGGGSGVDPIMLTTGSATAFFVGIFAVKIFLKLAKKRRIWIFSVYTFLLGVGSFFLLFL